MIEKEKFERHLRGTNLSENTISSYMFAIKQYGEQYDDITQKKLREYKVWLIENYKPKTVNLRLRAINCYLECIGKEKWKLPFVRVQQKSFLENVISEADYEYFKSCLKRDDETFWYFVIRFLAATGARVSELIQIKAAGNTSRQPFGFRHGGWTARFVAQHLRCCICRGMPDCPTRM